MKKIIMIFVLGFIATQLLTACNKTDDTTGSTATTNSMSTNTPATTNQ